MQREAHVVLGAASDPSLVGPGRVAAPRTVLRGPVLPGGPRLPWGNLLLKAKIPGGGATIEMVQIWRLDAVAQNPG